MVGKFWRMGNGTMSSGRDRSVCLVFKGAVLFAYLERCTVGLLVVLAEVPCVYFFGRGGGKFSNACCRICTPTP